MKKLGKMLVEALSSLFKKPATSEYPKKRRTIHDSVAGMISFEQIKCIGCNMCVRNCPANAIKIIKLADKVFSCEMSLANCIFCSQCVLSCPKKALHTTDNFELAQIDKSKLSVKLEDLNPEAKMTPEALAAIEAAAAKAKEAALAAAKAKQAQTASAAAAEAAKKAESVQENTPSKEEPSVANAEPADAANKSVENKDIKTSESGKADIPAQSPAQANKEKKDGNNTSQPSKNKRSKRKK